MLDSLEKVLGPEAEAFISRLAAATDTPLYLIGGTVRDLFLGVRSADVDFMLEGDATAFVKKLKEGWDSFFPGLARPGQAVYFKRYLTAKLRFSEPLWAAIDELDFSSARSESYPVPGGVPDIGAGSLQTDLARRDFSINAMAVRLNGRERGALSDFHAGRADLQAGLIKVLHEQSFIDDPARLIRALRFKTRLSFALEEKTRVLFDQAKESACLQHLPRGRLFDEFRKALLEPEPGAVLEAMSREGLLQQIDPRLVFDEGAVQRAKETGGCVWARVFSALCSRLSAGEYQALVHGSGLPEKTRKLLLKVRSAL